MAAPQTHGKEQEENLETYCLIWLDEEVNKSQDNIRAQKKLRTFINHLITFEDVQSCLTYIESVSKDDRIIFIVSGQLSQRTIPKVIHHRQITSIYIYCWKKDIYREWGRSFKKVKAVLVDLDELIHRIQTDQNRRQKKKLDEPLPIYMFDSNDMNEELSTSELSGQYLYSQLLIECLIRMKMTTDDKNELINLCNEHYKGNIDVLNIIDEFKRNYSSNNALWWFTRESFLYRMLNKALRIQNIHVLFLFRFFIRDIEEQLKQYPCSYFVQVYRAQLMLKDEVQLLEKSIGKFIAINSFFSTSIDLEQAKSFFSYDENINDNDEQILFEIIANPQLNDIKPYSDISPLSYYPEEKEILFMLGSVFQLKDICRDNNNIIIIKMELCSTSDYHFKPLFQQMLNKYTNHSTNLLDLANILKDMGKWNDAEKYYLRLINQLSSNDINLSNCYQGLGSVVKAKGDYRASLNWYYKALEIKRQKLKSNDLSIADTYNSIGNVYFRLNDQINALESYNQALEIYKEAFDENHPDVAMCMDNIGNVYSIKQEYSTALKYYKTAISIREKYLPENHCDLGNSHGNFGNICRQLGNYNDALIHYHLELEIYRKSRPPTHPSLASTMASIGLVHEDKNDLGQALSYCEKAARIYRCSLNETHPNVIQIEKDIQRISLKLNSSNN